MGRVYDPARATRERLLLVERRQRAREESQAVGEGVAETVALSRARGTAFDAEGGARGARQAAYRRMTGLDWLAKKGRISAAQKAAGERYGECFRRAGQTASIGSTLEVQPGGAAGGPSLSLLLKMAEGRRQAEANLALYHRQLCDQGDLIAACRMICGQELTPREAVGGAERDAGRMEAVLLVALDILAASQG